MKLPIVPDLEAPRAAIRAALRKLLENDPPFKRIEYRFPFAVPIESVDGLAPKSLTLSCTCSSEPTTWQYPRGEQFAHQPLPGAIRGEAHRLWLYRCADCEARTVVFWVAFRSTEDDVVLRPVTAGGSIPATLGGTIEKVIQWPRWSVRIPKRIAKAFGEKGQLLERGIHCLQDGYGIGAAAYFRRVVEDEAREIVDLVRQVAVLEGDDEAARNAEEALKENSAAGRLKIASRRVPPSLRVDGQNPLEVLYGNLSGPLHSETEEQAVEVAMMLLKALLFVFEGIKQRVEEKQSFMDTIRAASQRIAKPKGAD